MRTRTQVVADAGLRVLAANGMRGLTHRAVDVEADLPAGSCSNCFRTRAQLIEALGQRAFERLTPHPSALEESASHEPSRDRWVELMQELFSRVQARPELSIALLELRLEATRRPELIDPLTAVVQREFDADLEFHRRSGLPGGREEIIYLHLAIGGLITEMLTLPEALGIEDVDETIATLVDRLVYPLN